MISDDLYLLVDSHVPSAGTSRHDDNDDDDIHKWGSPIHPPPKKIKKIYPPKYDELAVVGGYSAMSYTHVLRLKNPPTPEHPTSSS